MIDVFQCLFLRVDVLTGCQCNNCDNRLCTVVYHLVSFQATS